MGMNEFGVDCTKVIALMFQEMKIISKVDNVRFPRDWFENTKEQRAINEFLRHINEYGENPYVRGNVYENEEPKPGDILFFRARESYVANHSGVYLKNNRMIHCIDGLGCHFVDYSFFWKKKFFSLMRLEGN